MHPTAPAPLSDAEILAGFIGFTAPALLAGIGAYWRTGAWWLGAGVAVLVALACWTPRYYCWAVLNWGFHAAVGGLAGFTIGLTGLALYLDYAL